MPIYELLESVTNYYLNTHQMKYREIDAESKVKFSSIMAANSLCDFASSCNRTAPLELGPYSKLDVKIRQMFLLSQDYGET